MTGRGFHPLIIRKGHSMPPEDTSAAADSILIALVCIAIAVVGWLIL